MKEHLFAALEFDGKSRVAEGVAVRYSDRAARQLPGGSYSIMVRPGAIRTIDDAILNVQHDRARPLARTGGGGLTFQDGQEALRVRAELPDTAEGRDAATLLERRVLRGFSLELDAHADDIDDESRTLTIEDATVTGVALVDRPRFHRVKRPCGDSRLVTGRSPDTTYGYDETISDRDTVRKQRVQSGAFRHSLNDKDREIGIQIGDDPGKILGSKLAGTVQFKDDDKRLAFTLPKGLPDTTYAQDLKAQLDAGLILGVSPLFRIPPADVFGATEQIPEPGNPDTIIEVVSQAVLFGIAVRPDPGPVRVPALRGRGKFWILFSNYRSTDRPGGFSGSYTTSSWRSRPRRPVVIRYGRPISPSTRPRISRP